MSIDEEVKQLKDTVRQLQERQDILDCIQR